MLESFTAYATLHGLITIGGVVGIALLIIFGRSQPASRQTLIYGWIAFVVVVQIVRQVSGNLPGNFDPQRSLPLHVCDIVPWIGIFALLRPRPWSLSITYFWGIGLSIFAFLIPIVSEPPTELAFWVFWLAHWQIVATAAYLVWAQDYTPNWRDWRYACVFTGIYMLLAVPVNLWLGSDYGYVGKEGIAAVVAPWPQLVPLLWVVECIIFALFLMPFLRRPQAPTAS